jgi:hypothetical protein
MQSSSNSRIRQQQQHRRLLMPHRAWHTGMFVPNACSSGLHLLRLWCGQARVYC